ncbi:lipid-A-disaccharide synthase [Desulfovibrio cuneatus]|uniref:lipid-A-disaccharide synthase n=1 Tax=Desulfovibrio cuneatus TaxID=159728 RepID=UPI00047F8658|nr:lipid-A-disaccharide synthase [Desulfovibrio cuneatus]
MLERIWISAGEASGDLHGGLLVEALRAAQPGIVCQGMGGAAMRAAGLEALFRTESLSVMGFTEVLGHLPRIFCMLREMERTLARLRPQAVVVIDAPSFHFPLIKAARKLGIPVYYYISPKVWASRQNRAQFIKENVRRVISILPFEVPFYQKFGMEVDYVGNPLVDVVDEAALARITPQPGLIGLLPGSRKKEVSALLPEFGGAARILLQRLPHLRFAITRAPGLSEEFIRSFWPADVPMTLQEPDNRWAFMRQCQMLIVASGTVTLESALAGTPTLVTYKLSSFSYHVLKQFVRVPYISLPNLILNRQVFPEMLQAACNAGPLAEAALRWLAPADGSNPLEDIRQTLATLRPMLGEKGAPKRAANLILGDFAE